MCENAQPPKARAYHQEEHHIAAIKCNLRHKAPKVTPTPCRSGGQAHRAAHPQWRSTQKTAAGDKEYLRFVQITEGHAAHHSESSAKCANFPEKLAGLGLSSPLSKPMHKYFDNLQFEVVRDESNVDRIGVLRSQKFFELVIILECC